jgi:SPP1 family predicted phage head-tail adaptor
VLSAGRLRHRVVIQRRIDSQDPVTGAVSSVWATVWDNVPAAIEDMSGRELLAAQAAQSEATSRVVLRFLDGITASHRIVHGDEVYNIKSPPLRDKESRREYITLLVSRGLNDGS